MTLAKIWHWLISNTFFFQKTIHLSSFSKIKFILISQMKTCFHCLKIKYSTLYNLALNYVAIWKWSWKLETILGFLRIEKIIAFAVLWIQFYKCQFFDFRISFYIDAFYSSILSMNFICFMLNPNFKLSNENHFSKPNFLLFSLLCP